MEHKLERSGEILRDGFAAIGVRFHYPVPTDDVVSVGLRALTRAIHESGAAEARQGMFGGEFGYGADYENAVFRLWPYYWGECECGYTALLDPIRDEPDGPECYSTVLHLWFDAWATMSGEATAGRVEDGDMIRTVERTASIVPGLVGTTVRTERSAGGEMKHQRWRGLYAAKQRFNDWAARRLCRQYSIPWNNGVGSWAHCTCGRDARVQAWIDAHPHPAECPSVRPNFCHKETGTTVSWYKYIGRDMEMNMRGEWSVILKDCLGSLGDPPR